MRKIPRRRFIGNAGKAAALGYLAAPQLGAAPLRFAIVADPSDSLLSSVPVKWAATELRGAIETRGGNASIVPSVAGAADAEFIIELSPAASRFPREGFRISLGRLSGKAALQTFASDARGYVYALTELADRVRHAASPDAALSLAKPVEEQPANTVRSIARAFVSDVEDKPWFYDKGFWRDYLTTLATNRFNRFSLTFGLGYDFPRDVVGDYMHFAYPYFVDVPGYKVRAVPLDDAERDRNFEMLRFIVDETAARGLEFQLGLWTHAYEWTDSPRAQHHIEGLTPETHAPYCRDALTMILKACPGITGVTMRIHGESGIPEGSYDFWRVVFDGVTRAGRPIEIDMHAKGIDSRMFDLAAATGMPVKVSPKYWAEHMGLGYHQAAIRELEMPTDDNKQDAIFSLSNGSRRFLRYGYGDLFQEGRRFDVLFRMWPGTQRMLIWGDPATAGAYGHASHFCGASGVELCEPLFFKGREGTGLPGGRCGYADKSLNPEQDWQKYAYTYRVWGQLLYNPRADPDQWQRYLRTTFAKGAAPVETSLAHASRVLPMLTTAHQPSASNRGYWVEVPANMPMVEHGAPVPYSDTPTPKRFGTVSPLDPQMFSSVAEHAGELLSGKASGKYSPIEVARFFEQSAASAESAIESAAKSVPSRSDPQFRRVEEDVRIQTGLARFYAAKLRAGVLFEIYQQTGDPRAHEQALTLYRQARSAWAAMAERARGVYVPDLTYGEIPVRRGHWTKRLPAIDQDLAVLEKVHFDPNPSAPKTAALAIDQATGQPSRVSFKCEHTPPKGFEARKDVALTLSVQGAAPAATHLFYRHVNQAERWQSVEMRRDGHSFHASIPAAYAQSPFALQYYFELRQSPGSAALFPGFNKIFTNQPYYLLQKI
jgi:hypothetical protein